MKAYLIKRVGYSNNQITGWGTNVFVANDLVELENNVALDYFNLDRVEIESVLYVEELYDDWDNFCYCDDTSACNTDCCGRVDVDNWCSWCPFNKWDGTCCKDAVKQYSKLWDGVLKTDAGKKILNEQRVDKEAFALNGMTIAEFDKAMKELRKMNK